MNARLIALFVLIVVSGALVFHFSPKAPSIVDPIESPEPGREVSRPESGTPTGSPHVATLPVEPAAGPTDESAALAAAWNGPDAETRIGEILDRWARTNPAAALRAILARPAGPLRILALMRLAGAWAERDPRGAADAMLALEDLIERDRGLGQAISTWSAQDAREAIDWLETKIELDAGLALHLAQAYGTWATNDAPTAFRDALDRGADPGSMRAVLANWGHDAPEDAYAFFTDYLSSTQQSENRSVLLLAAATNPDPSIANRLIDAELASSPSPANLAQLGRSLALVDASLASRIVDRLPDGAAKTNLRDTIRGGLLPIETSLPAPTGLPADDGDTIVQDFGVAGDSTTVKGFALRNETTADRR